PGEMLAKKMHKLPPVTGFLVENAQTLLEAKELKYKLMGKGPYVKRVFIKDETIYLERGDLTIRQDKVPRVTGLTLREAMQKIDLSRFRIELRGKGNGIVRRQEPPPGKKVSRRTSLILVCN
ncbi:MAG TPA: PASTA domain-containing protein, partial [Candidatus Aenigmarchaeota archaeon]|nr:PASTA domain-containing protein [Candidatus Aenigmarchaeota archaeon]